MTTQPPWKRHAHVALGLLGLGAAGAMLRHTDFAAVRAFGGWAGFVLAIEGVRVAAEAMATRSLLGAQLRLPWWTLIRVHLAGYAIAMVMPAGRTIAEASKAVMLRPWLGAARCAGVGATNQALVMFATGLTAVVCALAAWWWGHASLAATVSVQAAALLASGIGMLAMLRSPRLMAWAARRVPRIAKLVQGAGDGARVPGVRKALAWFVVHRSVQAVQLGVLASALGLFTPLRTLAITGASIVGTSVGVAVPAQLGVVGGALALAAPGLGFAASQALAMALMLHAAQFTWVAIGFATWALTKPARSLEPAVHTREKARLPG